MCFDCKRDPCACYANLEKNSLRGIRCFSIRGKGLIKYWANNRAWKGQIEIHLTVNPGEFPELERLIADLVARHGKPEEYL